MGDLAEEIRSACLELSKKTLIGLPLESCSPRLLDVSEAELDEHVIIQPAAIAFFGVMLKEAKRNLDALTRKYKRWEKKKYAEAKASLGNSKPKATLNDIESKVVIDNEYEIEEWEEKIDELQERVDALEVWYESWRQKGYTLRQHAELAIDELNSKNSLDVSNRKEESLSPKTKLSERVRSVRDIMSRHKHNSAE